MKNILIITAILFSFGATAQVETKEEVKGQKIEVIKIIDGDTVLHTVRDCTPGEFDNGHRKMHRYKMKDCDMSELGPGHGNHKGHGSKKHHMMKKGRSSNINAYPNPTKDEINVEFEVLKGNAELSIRGMDGKAIFNKTYKEAGEYKEKIKLNNKKNEILFIQLKEEGRVETRKIIVD